MVFSSALFLLAFLPVVFLCHLIIKDIRIKNILLLVASLGFYSVGEPVYVLLMLFSIAANYVFGRLVCGGKGKTWLAVSAVFNIGLLGVFKYADFAVGIVNSLTGAHIPMTGIRLPIGISFFTFQAMSYVVDVYRTPSLSQKNILKLALYISFFPQLIAGPIVQYGDIAAEIDDRHASVDDVSRGLRRFIFGLSKKLLIANCLGYAADSIFAMSGGGALPAWCGAIFYSLQIYYDFSGYSDMAIGLGGMFGFHFRENFDYPYASCSIRDFWRRWHISLSSWFRSYVYIPMGGNRKGEARTELNRLTVFFLTGLWHGASLNFVVWGLMHGIASVLESVVSKRIKIPDIISRVYTLLIVVTAFVFFRADTLPDAVNYLSSMFSKCADADLVRFVSLLDPKLIICTVAAVVFAMPMKKKIDLSKPFWEKSSYAVSLILFAVCVLEIAVSGYDPFIYFRF